MNKKLTLLLDETVIDQAKTYAEDHKKTLSGMVENYFRYITSQNRQIREKTVSPELENLAGIITIPETLDIKEEYRQHRAKKACHD